MLLTLIFQQAALMRRGSTGRDRSIQGVLHQHQERQQLRLRLPDGRRPLVAHHRRRGGRPGHIRPLLPHHHPRDPALHLRRGARRREGGRRPEGVSGLQIQGLCRPGAASADATDGIVHSEGPRRLVGRYVPLLRPVEESPNPPRHHPLLVLPSKPFHIPPSSHRTVPS